MNNWAPGIEYIVFYGWNKMFWLNWFREFSLQDPFSQKSIAENSNLKD